MAGVTEEWPDVVFDDSQPQEEYDRVVEAVGELTSAVLDCKVKGIMFPGVAKPLRDYLTSVLATLEEGIGF